MRFLIALLFSLAALPSFGEVVYDHPRRDPYRKVGLAPDATSFGFADEQSFSKALKNFFGFSQEEIEEAKGKWKRGETTLWKLAPGSHFDAMWGANGRNIGAGTITFWGEYIQVQVSSGKIAQFLTICGNPIICKGELIKPRVIRIPGENRNAYKYEEKPYPVKGEDKYSYNYEEREVPVPGPERVVLVEARRRPELYSKKIAEYQQNSIQLGSAGVIFLPTQKCCPADKPPPPPPGGNPCPPGEAPPPPIGGIRPRPNPRDPNDGLGPRPRR